MKPPSLLPLALPLTILAQAALIRVAAVSGLLVVLWLAIWWAAAKP